jgi:UDP-GlcNAc:undecaprenyl-phosphate GlcNAc-1-phosphate transferase
MLTYTVAFLLAALCTLILTPIVRDVAVARGLVDDPTAARKVHELPVPRLGGIAIAAGFYAPVVALYFYDNDVSDAYLMHPARVSALFVGGLSVVVLGLLDDVYDLSPLVKLGAQLIVACLAIYLGYEIHVIANPFGAPIDLGWFAIPVTLLWIVGIMNAVNLIDGLDGLATGISLFAVSTLFVLAVIQQNIIVGLTSIALAGALVGFLRYNFNPASIFMGDSGSLFLGYVLALTAISGSAKSTTVVSLVIPLLALGLPVMDTTLAVFRRLVSGRNIFAGDREHMHHSLLDL